MSKRNIQHLAHIDTGHDNSRRHRTSYSGPDGEHPYAKRPEARRVGGSQVEDAREEDGRVVWQRSTGRIGDASPRIRSDSHSCLWTSMG
jgi:hypothetical protein